MMRHERENDSLRKTNIGQQAQLEQQNHIISGFNLELQATKQDLKSKEGEI